MHPLRERRRCLRNRLWSARAREERLRVVQMMARGEVLTVIGMAKRLKVHPDTMGKHLKVLRRAKLLRGAALPDVAAKV